MLRSKLDGGSCRVALAIKLLRTFFLSLVSLLLIKSCSIISVLFLQYFLPLSNSDSTCSSNNSPNNNPAILAPQRPHLILGQDDGGGGGDLHQHLGQHLHHSGEQQPKKHHSFQLSLAIIWSLMCDIVHRKLPQLELRTLKFHASNKNLPSC